MADRTPGLGFLVDVVMRGTVLGIEPVSEPDQVTAVLGSEFAENRQRAAMWRDYGLVEYSWTRASTSQPWRPDGMAVQVYRLNTVGMDALNPVVAAHHGPLPAVVPFDQLRAALTGRGVELIEIPSVGPDAREFWQPDSQAWISVGVGDGVVLDGCVYSIGAPLLPEAVAARHGQANTAPLKQALRWHLLEATDEQRALWVTRRQPVEPTDRANWWLHLLLLIKGNVHDRHASCAAWARLYLWGVTHATAIGVFTTADAAISVSSFVVELRLRDVAVQLADVVPSADFIVRTCLSEIPMSLEVIPDATDLHALDLETMRQSRRAKNLVNAASWHADHVRDPQLAAELTAWMAALPRLV